ncbi:hypothetical protein WAI453_000196 [Rhynchosporium graminicola]
MDIVQTIWTQLLPQSSRNGKSSAVPDAALASVKFTAVLRSNVDVVIISASNASEKSISAVAAARTVDQKIPASQTMAITKVMAMYSGRNRIKISTLAGTTVQHTHLIVPRNRKSNQASLQENGGEEGDSALEALETLNSQEAWQCTRCAMNLCSDCSKLVQQSDTQSSSPRD